MSTSIIVYTQQSCGHCHRQMEWMNKKHIPFEERDLSKEDFRNEFLDLEGKGTPLTLLKSKNTSEIITGFNEKMLAKRLLLD
ncbi:glutaredoxin family protein [Alkalihalophilus lindianensis]|uniref:Glutaredoxin family protein n=1 Tax=Alkalihalophilus lindianensis TaxID=1630542 RepID=A0ABU3X9X7_9BACI|nr:glutaredoxin family protein [Alkalihalophilus lindianensis]MDV2684422.1 glutaredoxin family protein [Alkalihalophilus lindianensis]